MRGFSCQVTASSATTLPGQHYFRDLIPQLRADFPDAAIYVFDYESFRDYSETGAWLAQALAAEQQSRQFSNIVLIGHSMGGLVARTAAKVLPSSASVPLRGVLTLGTPNLGTPLPGDVLGNWLFFTPGVRTAGGESLLRSLPHTTNEPPLFLFGGDISGQPLPLQYKLISLRLCNLYDECANDGVVPLRSAFASSGPSSETFDAPTVTRHASYSGYDHSDMKGGKLPLALDGLYLDIARDVRSLLTPVLFAENHLPNTAYSPFLRGTALRTGMLSQITAHDFSYFNLWPFYGDTTRFYLVMRNVTTNARYYDCRSPIYTVGQVGAVVRTISTYAVRTGTTFTFPMAGSECGVVEGGDYWFYFENVSNGNFVGGTIGVDADDQQNQRTSWTGR